MTDKEKKIIFFFFLIFILTTGFSYDLNNSYVTSCSFSDNLAVSNCTALFDKSEGEVAMSGFTNTSSCPYMYVNVTLNKIIGSIDYLNFTIGTQAYGFRPETITVDSITVTESSSGVSCGSGGSLRKTVNLLDNHDYSYKDNVLRIRIGCSSFCAGEYRGIIYEISGNISNTTNLMPEFDFNISVDSCYNKSYVFQDLPVNITVISNDSEGDTQYYAISSQNENSARTITFDQGDIKVTRCSPTLISAFLNTFMLNDLADRFMDCSVNPENPGIYTLFNNPEFVVFDSCKVTNRSEFYILEMRNYLNTSSNMVVLNPDCTSRKEVFIDLKREIGYLEDFDLLFNSYLLNLVNNTMNLTVYSQVSPENIVLRLKFLKNDSGDILVYSLNSTNTTFISSIDAMEIKDYSFGYSYDLIQGGIQYNFSRNNYDLFLFDKDDIQKNYTNLSSWDYPKISRYFGLSSSNYSFLEGLYFTGNVKKPEFSTVIPDHITVKRGQDRIDVTMYVTDSYHLARNDFTYKTKYLNINECKYNSGVIPSINPSSPDFDLLRFFRWFIGQPTRDYLSVAMDINTAEKVFMFFFLLGFIFMFLITWDFIIPMIIIGALGMVTSFILGFLTMLAVSSIFTALGLAILLVFSHGGKKK